LQQGKNGAGWVLGKQYLRAATSIGANVEEAQSAESRPDFVHKYGIAQKEARESLYWLKLLAESGIIPLQRLRPLMKETEELFAVITGIILSTKGKGLKSKG
jgi:four helix bundle protein